MASWRLAYALAELRARVDELCPGRSKASDGTIGDADHAKTKSEHNPDSRGIVRALDLTHDPAHGADGGLIAEDVVATMDRRGVRGYVIWARRIRSTYVQPGVWRPYRGSNPHTSHVHVSILSGVDDRARWELPRLAARQRARLAMMPPSAQATAAPEPPPWPFPGGHVIAISRGADPRLHDGRGWDSDLARSAITAWQSRMSDRGWRITVDGIYGDASARTCRLFQAESGLDIDSIVGPVTWRAAWTKPIL